MRTQQTAERSRYCGVLLQLEGSCTYVPPLRLLSAVRPLLWLYQQASAPSARMRLPSPQAAPPMCSWQMPTAQWEEAAASAQPVPLVLLQSSAETGRLSRHVMSKRAQNARAHGLDCFSCFHAPQWKLMGWGTHRHRWGVLYKCGWLLGGGISAHSTGEGAGKHAQRRRDQVPRRNKGVHGPVGVAVPSQAPQLACLLPTAHSESHFGLGVGSNRPRRRSAIRPLRPVMWRCGRTATAAGPGTRTQPMQ